MSAVKNILKNLSIKNSFNGNIVSIRVALSSVIISVVLACSPQSSVGAQFELCSVQESVSSGEGEPPAGQVAQQARTSQSSCHSAGIELSLKKAKR